MIVLTVLVGAGALLLVLAGLDHIREPVIVAKEFTRLGAASLGMVEMAAGVSVLVALVVRIPGGRWPLVAQGLLYLGFLGYLSVRYHRHDRGDCRCARMAARIGVVGLLRVAVVPAVTIVAAIGYPAAVLPIQLTSHLLLGVAASVGLCLLLHALPPAIDGLSRRTVMGRYL